MNHLTEQSQQIAREALAHYLCLAAAYQRELEQLRGGI